jgi:hypothetical protein
LRADQAGAGFVDEGAEQRFQPARLRQGVVVQENEGFAARQRRTVVAGGDEAAVRCAPVVAHAGDARQGVDGLVAAAVVDDDHLERGCRRMGRQRAQAGEGMRELVVDRDHDARRRRVRGRHVERRERRGLGQVQLRRRQRRRPTELRPGAVPGHLPAAGAQARPAASHQTEAAQEHEPQVGGRNGHAAKLLRRGCGGDDGPGSPLPAPC